jgi:hypothetical protein
MQPAGSTPETDTEAAARRHTAFEARLASDKDMAQQLLRKVREDASDYLEALRALIDVHTSAADEIERKFL